MKRRSAASDGWRGAEGWSGEGRHRNRRHQDFQPAEAGGL